MCAKLGYPSVKDLKWIFQINKIIYYAVTVQYIDISYEIWDKNIVDLKGNTTVKKQIHVVGDLVKVPRELIKLHKDVFVTADIIFVNGIPFLFCSVAILSSP